MRSANLILFDIIDILDIPLNDAKVGHCCDFVSSNDESVIISANKIS